ncbi:electron transfer flavoprotein subunit alpha [bacterium (Candidatus Blackallbacteria) CG17_big_fil_post_rev_8_21_14_2_50_48_46]|uniref:Electron transfer flavoprotein subunit alpha n=1 Tax=bacterium (Candidatus Blackallbacteria) CG17_big_fil_post_rev_8_21_14_2_50_48_46 TaxID=2014261 RepID=A0A2M7G304_9BACT|nr:MAG: electron transfer flavoprotein subunit alpha [bacterium (Candidatus Blackallbacteria) CG18_big_fil_WC_8_21_14_2_50_49_26]PIW16204.1 MAG: electron transfer flavoprotein subunit alpha [bacterium (Candidatus Blackallbacteria) CG17_big_fil_post_rev_8_21_14_2_50_48_46]PIW49913.1 MAG: electron transfer flavoprotein subunit alpha [bacterium (Candidatus Blackallbacteria) CG13_big_fil_rev_8_21_14_2_50_49_14]
MNILVIAETKDGNLRKTSLELLSQAKALNASSVTAVLLGKGVAGLAARLGHYGAHKVLVAEHDLLENYSTDGYTKAIHQIADQIQPDLILFAASSNGKDLAPRLAARLNTGLVSDALELSHDGSKFVAVRPMFAGKAYAKVSVQGKALVSLRPNVTPVAAADESRAAEVMNFAVNLSDSDIRAKVVAVEKADSGKLDVAEADIVVSGGRGFKGPENFHLVESLAGALGGAVGASRAVVDAGWRPHGEQVGQTGKTVSPTLYVACAVSGAMQHLAGMSSSKYIVAVNTDPEAPIFKVATYGLVGDVFEVLPQLTEAVNRIKASNN